MKRLRIILIIIILLAISIKLPTVQTVRFTSYYPGDGTNSGNCTASGLCTDDFSIKDGRYYYQGKLVVATATYNCTQLETGVCGKYNDLPEGYQQYHLFDSLKLKYQDVYMDAIVLDICGACYWPEPLQRYDVYMVDESYITDINGEVIKPLTFRMPSLIILCVISIAFLLYTVVYKKVHKKS